MPTTPTADPAADPTPPTSSPSGCLPNGELRRQVAGYLHEAAGHALTAGEIARALSRSARAVANALTTLASGGAAELVSGRPARY
jgi:nitric oxide reductase NorQ protein